MNSINASDLINLNLGNSLNIKSQNNKVEDFSSVFNKVINDDNELKKACKEFESYFINLTFKEMRKTINYSEGIIKRSSAEEIFQSMLDEETAKNISESSGIGLANMMYEQLSNNKSK